MDGLFLNSELLVFLFMKWCLYEWICENDQWVSMSNMFWNTVSDHFIHGSIKTGQLAIFNGWYV
jgi:hypothetical protein